MLREDCSTGLFNGKRRAFGVDLSGLMKSLPLLERVILLIISSTLE
jgi:hypothetical protein